MTETPHEDVQSLLGAYVLGAVPTDELAAVRAHIASCDECSAEADRLAAAVPALDLGVAPVAPPADFARGILRRITEERHGARPLPPRRRSSPLVWLTAAAVVVTLALGAVTLDARDDADSNRRVATALLAAAPGMALAGEQGVEAKVLPADEGSVFVATGLSELDDELTYQLWFIDDGAPVSAGTFEASEGVAVLRTTRSPRGLDGAAVTVEPRGGSDRPTSDPVLRSG